MMWFERALMWFLRLVALVMLVVAGSAVLQGVHALDRLDLLAKLVMDKDRGITDAHYVSMSAVVLPMWSLFTSLVMVLVSLRIASFFWTWSGRVAVGKTMAPDDD